MRSIYLHIGCGKTGSSALQVWLSQNAEAFYERGISYPQAEGRIQDPYQITSGNGARAVAEIQAGNAVGYFTDLVERNPGDILLSSEAFQLLSNQQLLELRQVLCHLPMAVHVIAYVRDLYDILSSGYSQLVKRNSLTAELSEYIYGVQKIQQFDVVRDWASVFESMSVLHYETEKGRLDQSMLDVLGVPSTGFPKMGRATVNRSLTAIELELLRFMNHLYIQKFGDDKGAFSTVISDAIIRSRPEESTAIYYDKEIENHLRSKFGAEIRWINDRFFNGDERLAVFRSHGKRLTTEKAVLDSAYKESLIALFSVVEATRCSTQLPVVRADDSLSLDISDPRIVDALRNRAIAYEQLDLSISLTLMKAAQVLRPNGMVINQKVQDYQTRLNQDSTQ